MAGPEVVALLREAGAALQRGDARAAVGLLDRAEALDGTVAEVGLNRALACRMMGDLPGGIAALDGVLLREPQHFVALLSKGSLVEAASGAAAAARIWRAALRVAPAGGLPGGLAAALDHARAVVAADSARMQAHLRAAVGAEWAPGEEAARDRFEESLDVFAGAITAPVQRPMLLHYSRMPAIPFYDRALFPWLEELEAATPMIVAELEGALAAVAEDFAPYIQYPANVPVRQWGELNHSRKWSSYFLWRDGVRHDAACARCPGTAALIERLPLMRQPGFAPTAVFSALEPHTHIPPHTGSANTRLLCHLPLILPGPARFRVGPQTRDWRMGEAWVFDDTIEHEAWNDADAMRVILILDVWSPFLSEREKTMISKMMTARSAYYA
jgi:aspartate beta-hydroxylase